MITSNNIASLIGANVLDPTGDKIGSVGQVYLDATDGTPNWVSVRTGLFGTKESFVPLQNADYADDALRVGFEKDVVKDAPRIDADGEISPEEEETLYRYYGLDAGLDTTGGTGQYGSGVGGGTDSALTGTESTGFAAGDGVGTENSFDTTDRGIVGHDTSGPTTDEAMTRSEEHLRVGTERVQTGRARLRKYIVTENETVTVPVQREEVRLEREPITDANAGAAYDGPAISEEEHEVILSEDRVVTDKEAVPVERVRLDKETVTEQETVTDEVRKEQIELDEDGTRRPGTGL